MKFRVALVLVLALAAAGALRAQQAVPGAVPADAVPATL